MGSTVSFLRMCSVGAMTQRANLAAGGTPVAYLADLRCTPLDSAGEVAAAHRDIAERAVREPGRRATYLQTYISGTHDIQVGDLLVVAGSAYPVRAVEAYTAEVGDYLHLLVEDMRRDG